jgi:hypothetical protein
MSKNRFQGREQLKIAGTERPDRVPEIDTLAEEWRELDEKFVRPRRRDDDDAGSN